MPSRRLAIAVPTYNRAEILDETIRAMSSVLRDLDIPLVIRDDSDNDATERRARDWARAGVEVDYRRNEPALGHDANLIATLMAADAEHVWLLGDGMVPDPASVEPIVRSLCGQDFVFLNARETTDDTTVEDIASADLPGFMVRRVWEFTLTGATVYGPRVLDWCRSGSYISRFPNFCQLGLILHFMQFHADTRVTRLARRALRSTRRRRGSYWAARAVEVFAQDWCRVVTAHAAVFGPSALSGVLKSHAQKTGILKGRHLLALRAQGNFSLDRLRAYEEAFTAASPVPRPFAAAIAVIPVPLARLLGRLDEFRRNLRRAIKAKALGANPAGASS